MNIITTENSKEFSEKLEILLDEMDCENLEQADEKLNSYLESNEDNDLDMIVGWLNAIADGTHWRIDTDELTSYVGVYTYLECDGKDYEIRIENDYRGHELGAVDAIIEDVIAYEKEADGFVLSIKK